MREDVNECGAWPTSTTTRISSLSLSYALCLCSLKTRASLHANITPLVNQSLPCPPYTDMRRERQTTHSNSQSQFFRHPRFVQTCKNRYKSLSSLYWRKVNKDWRCVGGWVDVKGEKEKDRAPPVLRLWSLLTILGPFETPPQIPKLFLACTSVCAHTPLPLPVDTHTHTHLCAKACLHTTSHKTYLHIKNVLTRTVHTFTHTPGLRGKEPLPG